MPQVKYNDQKWWVLLNGEWIEFTENDWDKVKIEVWDLQGDAGRTPNWQPTPDQIYSLPNEVEFEIKKHCEHTGKECIGFYCQRCKFHSKQVAHLKESEQKKDNKEIMEINNEWLIKLNKLKQRIKELLTISEEEKNDAITIIDDFIYRKSYLTFDNDELVVRKKLNLSPETGELVEDSEPKTVAEKVEYWRNKSFSNGNCHEVINQQSINGKPITVFKCATVCAGLPNCELKMPVDYSNERRDKIEESKPNNIPDFEGIKSNG